MAYVSACKMVFLNLPFFVFCLVSLGFLSSFRRRQKWQFSCNFRGLFSSVPPKPLSSKSFSSSCFSSSSSSSSSSSYSSSSSSSSLSSSSFLFPFKFPSLLFSLFCQPLLREHSCLFLVYLSFLFSFSFLSVCFFLSNKSS